MAGKLLGWSVCRQLDFPVSRLIWGWGQLCSVNHPHIWQHGSGLHSAQQLGWRKLCVIPRRTALELGLGAAVLWLGTRQSGCCSTAGAHKPVHSLLQSRSCSVPG